MAEVYPFSLEFRLVVLASACDGIEGGCALGWWAGLDLVVVCFL